MVWIFFEVEHQRIGGFRPAQFICSHARTLILIFIELIPSFYNFFKLSLQLVDNRLDCLVPRRILKGEVWELILEARKVPWEEVRGRLKDKKTRIAAFLFGLVKCFYFVRLEIIGTCEERFGSGTCVIGPVRCFVSVAEVCVGRCRG